MEHLLLIAAGESLAPNQGSATNQRDKGVWCLQRGAQSHFVCSEEPGHLSFMMSQAGGIADKGGRSVGNVVMASDGEVQPPQKPFIDLHLTFSFLLFFTPGH